MNACAGWPRYIFATRSFDVACTCVLGLCMIGCDTSTPPESVSMESNPSRSVDALADRVAALDRDLQKRDQTVWSQEVEAQRYGRWFTHVWDRLRTDHDVVNVLADAMPCGMELPALTDTESWGLGIQLQRTVTGGNLRMLNAEVWRAYLQNLTKRGFRLAQCEWHHTAFDRDEAGPRSQAHVILHVQNERTTDRWIVDAEVDLRWEPPAEGTGDEELACPTQVTVREAKWLRRSGDAGFVLAATLAAKHASANDFLGVVDLDRDGQAEIIFDDQRYRHVGNGGYAGAALSPHIKMPLSAAVFADLTNDGYVDLLSCDPQRVPQLFEGGPEGFVSEPRALTRVSPLPLPMSVTAGDIDGDGWLDLWIAQYRPPYRNGQMPTPYFDANDGDHSYLLVNQGDGTFRDETVARGLAAKARRRTYSSSFVDWDHDGDVDLFVVSDFAGIDVHANDGRGFFTDVTEDVVRQPHNFGMSHRFDDFDHDGNLDVLVTGMSSTTARRLDRMGAADPRFPEHNAMREVMGFGNRLYQIRDGQFIEGQVTPQVARTGWSWGISSFDLENDSDRDIYIANGHISGPSVRDYCSVFWRRDIYAASSQPDEVWASWFQQQQKPFLSGSWNGFEHNVLFCFDPELGYLNVGFLLGVACEFDSRAVVSHDVDEDGRMDLLVVENPRDRPSVLHVYRNQLPLEHHWIGLRLVDAPGRNVVGARVSVESSEDVWSRLVVTGDSFTSQHPAQVHFGLGPRQHVDRVRVVWADGSVDVLKAPAVDRYHVVGDESTAP